MKNKSIITRTITLYTMSLFKSSSFPDMVVDWYKFIEESSEKLIHNLNHYEFEIHILHHEGADAGQIFDKWLEKYFLRTIETGK